MTGVAWHARAECRTADWRMFFSNNAVQQRRAVTKYCDHCPVRDLCRADVEQREDVRAYGVWGGTLPAEREEQRRAARRAALDAMAAGP